MVSIHDRFVVRADEYLKGIIERGSFTQIYISGNHFNISSAEIYLFLMCEDGLSLVKNIKYINIFIRHENPINFVLVIGGRHTISYEKVISYDLLCKVVALLMQQGWDSRDKKDIILEMRKLENDAKELKEKLEGCKRVVELLSCW